MDTSGAGNTQNHGQDGLLGMTLHPGLLRNTGTDYVYVAYTYDADAGSGTRDCRVCGEYRTSYVKSDLALSTKH